MDALVKREAAPGLSLEAVPEPAVGINDVRYMAPFPTSASTRKASRKRGMGIRFVRLAPPGAEGGGEGGC